MVWRVLKFGKLIKFGLGFSNVKIGTKIHEMVLIHVQSKFKPNFKKFQTINTIIISDVSYYFFV